MTNPTKTAPTTRRRIFMCQTPLVAPHLSLKLTHRERIVKALARCSRTELRRSGRTHAQILQSPRRSRGGATGMGDRRPGVGVGSDVGERASGCDVRRAPWCVGRDCRLLVRGRRPPLRGDRAGRVARARTADSVTAAGSARSAPWLRHARGYCS